MKRFCYSCMEVFSGDEPICPHCGANIEEDTEDEEVTEEKEVLFA